MDMNVNVNKEWNGYESHPWNNGTGVIARRATLGIALLCHTFSLLELAVQDTKISLTQHLLKYL